MQTPIYPSTLDWGRIQVIVDELDEQFPDKFPDHTLSEKEISYRAGQLSIIRILKEKLKGLSPEERMLALMVALAKGSA